MNSHSELIARLSKKNESVFVVRASMKDNIYAEDRAELQKHRIYTARAKKANLLEGIEMVVSPPCPGKRPVPGVLFDEHAIASGNARKLHAPLRWEEKRIVNFDVSK